EPADESYIKRRFELAKYPLTNVAYGLFDGQHARRFDDYKKYSAAPDCPAIYLNWYDGWCVSAWLGGRLPDEHEWEYACRAQPGVNERATKYCFGDNLPGDEVRLADYAWFRDNSDSRTHPVASKAKAEQKLPNKFGLYHMHGLVWEWTSSWYH